MTTGAETAEDAAQLADLRTPLGQPGSGRVRYAAATHFYNRGLLSAEALEVYRILAMIDAGDPGPMLAQLGPGGEGRPAISSPQPDRRVGESGPLRPGATAADPDPS